MNTDFIYVIERYGVEGEEEQLVERAELVRTANGLVCRGEGGDVVLAADDVMTAIAGAPMLNEIRADHITRITATGEAYDHLPLVLTVPGDRDDFDESAWSETLAEEHTEQVWVIQPGRCRVLYVNSERWGAWRTPDGPRALPEGWPMVGLSKFWAELKFSELLSMTSGLDQATIGLATPGAVAACFLGDEGMGNPDQEASVWKRGDADADARLFANWLLDWVPNGWMISDDNFRAMLAQLFVEAALHDRNGIPTAGAMLCAGGTSVGFMDQDSSEWRLDVGLDRATVELVLDAIAERGGRFAEIVAAARDPQSLQGQARRLALAEWEQDRNQFAFGLVESEAEYVRNKRTGGA